MRHGSLFSGIGGFDLAAHWLGWENVFQVEINEFCQKVLKKNFPNSNIYGDIKEFDGTKYRGSVEIVSGGFPCQPFSTAGKRKGKNDDRYLWPEMLRVIREIKPKYIVGENVSGILSMENEQTFEQICNDLESEGYKVQPFIIPAASVQTWHRRDRVWIIANLNKIGCRFRGNKRPALQGGKNGYEIGERNRFNPNFDSKGLQGNICGKFGCLQKKVKSFQGGEHCRIFTEGKQWQSEWFEVAAEFCRNNDGVSNRVDRIRSLGNAVVPQLVYEIFKIIEEYDLTNTKTVNPQSEDGQ